MSNDFRNAGMSRDDLKNFGTISASNNVNDQLQRQQDKKVELENAAIVASQVRSKKASKSTLKKSKVKKSEASPKVDTSKKAGYTAGAKAVGDSVAKGGGGMDIAGDALLAGGAATLNPYAVAAGATLKVIGSISAKKEKQAALELARKQKRRDSLEILVANLGTGVGSQGMA